MATPILVKPQTSQLVFQGADAPNLLVASYRDGSLATSDFIQKMIVNGRGFAASFGQNGTLLTTNAQALNRPSAWLRVPAGTTILPFTFAVGQGDTNATATAIHFVIRTAANDIGNGTSSAATLGPISLAPNNTSNYTSQVTARQLATGDTTAETNPVELVHEEVIAASAAGSDGRNFVWPLSDRAALPLLIGPATFQFFIYSSTANASFTADAQWVETPSAMWI